MSARIYGIGPGEQACYPDKALANAQAAAAFKAAQLTLQTDDRGDDHYVVSWAGWRHTFRQLSDAERLIETLPLPIRR